jgi:glycosyltransferase involved in cell wall biosynthesis
MVHPKSAKKRPALGSLEGMCYQPSQARERPEGARRRPAAVFLHKRAGSSMLDIGIIIPELSKYGGAERLLIECLVRWQHKHRLTVYSGRFNEKLLTEVGVHRVTLRALTPPFEGENSIVLNATLLPKIWECEIGRHDIYHSHLWPMHLLDLHPMVWYPHEPLRALYDLRHDQNDDEAIAEGNIRLHLYPKQTYELAGEGHGAALIREATLRALTALDSTGRPDRVVANSQYMARYLGDTYRLSNIDVVYPGVTLENAIELPHSGDIVLTIGQLWRNKRIRLIIEAVRHTDDIQLYIVGSGPEKRRLKSLVESMGIDDRVFFLHGLDNHEVQILLARCLCVVFTPIREPFGIVALEALAAGKPLIAVNEGGFSEIVDEGCTFLVPPLPIEIAQRIRQLQADRPLARRMGERGRMIARQFSWDRTAAELLSIVESCHADWVAAHQAPVADKGDDTPLIGIHYFNWYGDGFGGRHWSDNSVHGGVSDMPELGYYSSLSGETIAHHLDLIEGMGVDFVVFNIHVDERGIDRFQINAAETMLDVMERRGSRLRFAVNLCLYTTEAAEIEAAVKLLRAGLMQRDRQQVFRSKPLLFIFWTGLLDGDHAAIRLLRSFGEDFLRIAVSLRPFDPRTEGRKTFDLFDGACLFSPLEISAPDRWEQAWQYCYDASGEMPAGLRIATVSPGYDDSHLQDPNRHGNPHRNVPRNDGATYRRSISFAERQAEPPEMILISTFNEFHENTQIEPSLRFGRRYIEMTREFIEGAKAAGRKRRTEAEEPAAFGKRHARS